jgi:two-component system, NarL family, response regulator NreC
MSVRRLSPVPTAIDPRDRAITVVLAEAHEGMRGALRALLTASPALSVVAAAGNLSLTRQHLGAHRPDVLVLDLNMPDGSGLEIISEVRRSSSPTRLLVLGGDESPALAERALAAGASGYLVKDRADEYLEAAVVAVAAGREYLSPDVADGLARRRRALTAG